MKNKQKLTELEVQSFVTSIEGDAAKEIKGAQGTLAECLTILPNCMIGFSQGAHVCTRDSC